MRVVLAGGPVGGRGQEGRGRRAVDRGELAEGPGERPSNVRIGIAEELPDEGERAAGIERQAECRRSDVTHPRQRRSDEPPLPGVRRVGELLQLGPAVRLAQDPLGGEVGDRVHADPVTGRAAHPADQLPGPLRVLREAAAQEGDGEEAHLGGRLVREALGDPERLGRARAPEGGPEARSHRPQERRSHAEDGADARRHPSLRVPVDRIGQAAQSGLERCGEGLRLVELAGQLAPQRQCGRAPFGNEGGGARRGGARRSCAHDPTSRSGTRRKR